MTEVNTMSEFSKKHPALSEAGDTVLAILCGSFALVAGVVLWIAERVRRKEK